MSDQKLSSMLKQPNQRTPEKDFSGRNLISFMVGIYLAVNAIRDVYLLVEGPDCTHMKNMYIQGNQDYLSTLTSVSGFHRITNTALHVSQMAQSREEIARERLLRIAKQKAVKGAFLTSMPCTFITGVDYDRICASVSSDTGKAAIHVPGRSLGKEWLTGYEETLQAIASQISLERSAEIEDSNLAIVGYLFDRNEEDNRGNIRELQRLLHGMKLNLVSVWLEGKSFESLLNIQKAGTILSFPYGRKAARTIAKRLNAKLVECDLPFGLTATEGWLRKLGKFFSREKESEKVIDSELRRVVPKIEWVVPFLFQGRSFGYIGDPWLLRGFVEIIKLLGGNVPFAVITNVKSHLKGVSLPSIVGECVVEPTSNALQKFLKYCLQTYKIDGLITNSLGLNFISSSECALVEFGFPSYNRHALYDRPYLGFRGFLAFVDTLANQIRLHEVSMRT